MVDAETAEKLADNFKEIVGWVVLAVHLLRQWWKARRQRTQQKQKGKEKGKEEAELAPLDPAKQAQADEDARYMRNAVFSHMEMDQLVSSLQADVSRGKLETALVERDRDQWKRLSEEREADVRQVLEQLKETRQALERERKYTAKLSTRLATYEDDPT